MRAILLPPSKPMTKCARCNGSILKDGLEFTCINCGNSLPDKFTKEFIFNTETKRYEERYKQELVSKALMRHKE